VKPALLALSLAAGLATGEPATAQAPQPQPQPPRVVAAAPGAALPSLTGELELNPRQLAQLVAVRSSEIRYSRLGVDVAAYLSAAEAALYETVFFGSTRGDDIHRQRTVEERLSAASSLSVLDERSVTSEAGLRQRLPTAGEVSLSYRIVRRRNNIIEASTNNLQDTEWTGAVVINLKQPLLRGAGRSIVETDRRVAELERQVQWAQFHQQVLKSTAEALNAYWQLRRAQAARQLRDDSLANVRKMASDVDARVQAGRAAPSSRIEMSSTVVAREAEYTRAEQAAREAEAKVLTALNLSSATYPGLRLKAMPAALPKLAQVESVDQALQRALDQWPPYRISQLRLQQGKLRLKFADDQRLPQLDFNAGYTSNGLAYDRLDASRIASRDRYPEWSIGLNFEMPLGGNGKAGGQYAAQAARVQQSELELEAIRTSLANDLAQRRDELAASLQLVQQMRQDLQLRQQVLDAERERYNLGVGLLSQWLQRENELYEARQRMAEAMMRAQLAQVAWEFAQGSLLDQYDIALRNE
jgi:outer membrane protein TolC